MKALIIGATGATGKDLINLLLQDQDYTEIVIFVRRPSNMADPKLIEILTDFDKLAEVTGQIKGDIVFSCMGTTLKAAGSKDKQWHIDYEIPLNFARIAKENGVTKMVLLSAYGALAKSKVFYSKMKGKLEDDTASLAFNQYIIFRPGMLLRKESNRPAERIIGGMLIFLNRLGLIEKFRPLPTAVLAEKLAKAPKVLADGKHIIELEKILNF